MSRPFVRKPASAPAPARSSSNSVLNVNTVGIQSETSKVGIQSEFSPKRQYVRFQSETSRNSARNVNTRVNTPAASLQWDSNKLGLCHGAVFKCVQGKGAYRCRANMAHIRQSGPDYGLDFQEGGLKTLLRLRSKAGSMLRPGAVQALNTLRDLNTTGCEARLNPIPSLPTPEPLKTETPNPARKQNAGDTSEAQCCANASPWPSTPTPEPQVLQHRRPAQTPRQVTSQNLPKVESLILVAKRGQKSRHQGRRTHLGEVSRGEKMLESGTDRESYITEYTLVYEEKHIFAF